jgi:DNA helicase HerA-like ATPase
MTEVVNPPLASAVRGERRDGKVQGPGPAVLVPARRQTLLDGVQAFCRMLEVPRADEQEGGDDTGTQLIAPLISAHVGGERVAMGWVRPSPGAPVEVILGGGAALGIGRVTSEVRPMYPPGSRGSALNLGSVLETLQSLPVWLRCAGLSDSLAVADEKQPKTRASFEDYVAHLARTSFAWLVVAEPVGLDVLQAEMADLAYELPRIYDKRDTGAAVGLRQERLESRYRELAQAETVGLWNVHILVGGASEAAALRTAALLCSASGLANLPYVLRPSRKVGELEEVLGVEFDEGDFGASPFRAPSELLAAIARPPTSELPGIRMVLPSTFDVTPESTGDILLGEVLDQGLNPAGALPIAKSTLNRHVFVCGATGGGKSQTVRALLESLHDNAIPWMVIEPAKAEYARMAGRLKGRGEVLVIKPGMPDQIPGSLNPLEPEPGFPLQTHIDLVRALFLAAFEAEEPLPQVLSYALTRCYEEMGWELALGESKMPGVTPKYPTLGELQRVARDVVAKIGYGQEVEDNVKGFIDVRIGSLRLGTPGRFFEGGHPLDLTALLRKNVVLELEDIGNDQDKAFFMGTVVIRLVEHLRMRYGATEGDVGLRHMTVVEEAHRLLKNVEEGSPAAHAVELFAGLLAEIRAYGEGILVAEQIPSKLLPDVVKNSALKIVHRLPANDDREFVGATMNLTPEQADYVVTLPPGQAAVFADAMDRPLLVRMPLGEGREQAAGALTTPPLLRSRSACCGSACQRRPCTLRELTTAKRLAEQPRVILWIELLLAAHLVGEAEPRPDPHWLAELREAVEPRQLDCAIGQLAQAAIDTRYAGLAAFYQPEELAAHVAGRARAWLFDTKARRKTTCDGSETQWYAGKYRWIDVLRALQEDHGDRLQPHPDTEAWAARGIRLDGQNWAEQLSQLQSHPLVWGSSYKTIWGDDDPCAIERAAEALSYADDLIERIEAATGFLEVDCPWPAARLYPRLWAKRGEGDG